MAATLICLLVHAFLPAIPFTLFAAIGFLVLTMTAPLVLSPLASVWFAFSAALGRVMTPVLLTTVFLIVVTPIGWLVRRFKKDSHRLKEHNSGKNSVFHERDHRFTGDDIRHPY